MPVAERLLQDLLLLALVTLAGGITTAVVLRRQRLMWTWAATGLLLVPTLASRSMALAAGVIGACLLACLLGAAWHHSDLRDGADLAEAARSRTGIFTAMRRRIHRLEVKRRGWIHSGWLTVGQDPQGTPASIPVGYESGSHTLVVGATGSGKTVSEAWIAGRLIEHGHAAIVIDPKGDPLLRNQLAQSALRAQARFLEWTPQGPLAYNPYAQGSDSEIADKALSGEQFTEPHYLRQAQRYLGHAVRVMHAAQIAVTPVSLMAQLDPRELDATSRKLAEEQASEAQAYLDSLTDRQKRDLTGVRDRLSILAESDTRRWLDPTHARTTLDIHKAVQTRAVVYFRLDSDQRPLLAAMLATAIVSDLITVVARQQAAPIPAVVVIDEFSAVAAGQVARLFGRARSAGVSLILGTQELADLKTVGEGLREQTLGNVATVIAHRQNVPESAELIADMAGTKPVWVTTHQTRQGLIGSGPSGRGSRSRGYEYEIHPSRIKRLVVGEAVVITPGSGRPTIAQMCHPDKAYADRGVRPRLTRIPGLARALLVRRFRSLHHRLSRRTTTTRSTRRNP